MRQTAVGLQLAECAQTHRRKHPSHWLELEDTRPLRLHRCADPLFSVSRRRHDGEERNKEARFVFHMETKTMILAGLYVLLPLLDVLSYAEENVRRLDCVRASEQCLKEPGCSSKYRTMRQCVAGGRESNFSMVAGLEAKDECRSVIDALKQSPLYNCRCKRGMKKEKNCLRIYWGIYQTLQGNDFLEDSPYEPVNSRLSDIFRLAPILELCLRRRCCVLPLDGDVIPFFTAAQVPCGPVVETVVGVRASAL
ncbi:unnamed protein product [Pleuronectes platessa]|uniref:GDNF/GAS1 domain-containing protein n=1 Tax=Pleuronectes platessa TaxID=8262 RepID=A0A9N7TQ92_PLEPL|nr:unnamed protein product [Pleuronectes platessa]